MKTWIAAFALLAAANVGAWQYSGGAGDECKAAHDGLEFFYRDDRLHVRIRGIAPLSLHALGLRWRVHHNEVVEDYAITVRTSADAFRAARVVPVGIENGSAVFPWQDDWWYAGSVRARATVQFYFHGNSAGGSKFPAYKVWTSAHPGSLSIVRRLDACESVLNSPASEGEGFALPPGWGGAE